MTVLTVCGLNQSKIDEARETFLAQLKALEVQKYLPSPKVNRLLDMAGL